MTVQLKPEQEAFIEAAVRDGKYQSAADAMDMAVSLLIEKEERNEFSTKYGIPAWEILEAMRRSPHKDVDIEPERSISPVEWRELPTFE